MGRARLAALHGVATSYEPSPGRTLRVPEDTVVAVLAALGVDASTPQAVRAALDRWERAERERLLPPSVVVTTGRPPRPGTLPGLPEDAALRVRTETGQTLDWDPGPAVTLPTGCHTLHAEAPGGRSGRAVLIVAPERMPEPPGRTHGFLVQLYSLLSSRSWGMGDLGDLAELAAWSGRELGTGFLQLNPLHAAVPGNPTDPSPYRPSSRRFPDPVHLRVEDVPEYVRLPVPERERAAAVAARAEALREGVLRRGALIDRDAVWRLKREALELVRTVPLGPGRRAAYCAFLAEQGQALDDHATWCALAEIHGPDWRQWPDGLSDPRSPQAARARGEILDRVDFHCWLAWLTDSQLGTAQRSALDAGMPIGLVHDLAVGVHPSGADVWARQDVYATGMSVGAPPDAFTPHGQDWGLPPWRPDALAATGYAPYRGLLRGLLRHAGALRIDHVMGLSRLWWVPEGRRPTEGAYVRYDTEAMLGVLALEAHRAGAVVVGEDLGTVEPGMRDALAERGVLGTSVLWFERDYEERDAQAPAAGTGASPAPAGTAAPDAAVRERPRPLPPERWRAGCLATATTHDLPSTAARLTGEHVELRHRLGLLTRPLAEEQAEDAVETAEWLAVLSELGLLAGGRGDEEEAVRAVYRFLCRTPARMVGVWLPDCAGDRRPQNLPGTWDEYPNWRLPVADAAGRPVTLEGLAASPRLHALMTDLAGHLAASPADGAGAAGRP
ncbi:MULTISPECIES: 4-alpha-glucanotransferase [Streptomyces]|uniref:4-alpha-glucanotransferase n=2 Tax=Streptomyces TaxID=1883 RepID=A0A420V8T8_9ACTN|nr:MULTISPECIES: 4-alpha-glucanotransferase [Streptomyces]KNE84011.1 4-alpha-glucanotransferase [Streptomyces fradiae]OFA60808.1 4-alpha-glucanotransferase [Streptomyces fradiae]PQM24694.1 4-alpha-glucanotransferase [Streptomyces xinghaiensis]RKM98748.1 4-alpha-glucanotransferase [Streptomyces xinghaiensis]RNC76353.1 4-alpha-glucanotransferase [Streptomyces xinghaiensis]